MKRRQHILAAADRVCEDIMRHALPGPDGVIDVSHVTLLKRSIRDRLARQDQLLAPEFRIPPGWDERLRLEISALSAGSSKRSADALIWQDALESGEFEIVGDVSIAASLSDRSTVTWFVPDSGLRDVVGDTVRRWTFILGEAYAFASDQVSVDHLSARESAEVSGIWLGALWGYRAIRDQGVVEFIAPPVVVKAAPDGVEFVFGRAALPLLGRCIDELMRPGRMRHRLARVGDVGKFVDDHMRFQQ